MTGGSVALPRRPYAHVVRQLRQEVGFRCPVDDCGNPYLTWHHFDPPWREEQHHRPEGLIALCQEHASKADAGAFTSEQLRRFKLKGRARAEAITGRFDWMRRDLLAVVGGIFYLETDIVFQIGEQPCIWFTRDENNYLLLNFWMPTSSGEPRAVIHENFWLVPPRIEDLESPPNGRRLHIRYGNGDELRVEFFEIESADDLTKRYPDFRWANEINYPMTAVELWEKAPGTPIEFGPRTTRLPGFQVQGGFMNKVKGSGIRLDLPAGVGGRVFRDQDVRITDLVGADYHVLQRVRFEGCRIIGPCVLISMGSVVTNSNIGPLDEMLWELPAGRLPIGGVVADSCLFDRCSFVGIGFAVPHEELQQVREQFSRSRQ
jgi:hypothetical protein